MAFLLVCNDSSILFDEDYVRVNLGECRDLLHNTILVCAKMDSAVIHLFKDAKYDQRSVELRAYEVLQNTKIKKIITWREGDILYAAKLRKAFGISGQSLENAILFRDKVAMKQQAAKHQIPTPAFASVSNVTDILEFIKIHGYPVIVKPKKLLGSIGVTKIDRYEDISSSGIAWLNIMEGIVETYVEGDMYNVDGVYQNGRVVLAWPSGKLGNCFGAINGGIFGVYQLAGNNPLVERLVKFAGETLRSLQADDMSFHLECFLTKDNEIKLCEVGCRFAGAYNPDCWRLSLNLSVTDLSFKVQAGITINESIKPPKSIVGYLMIAAKLGTVVGLPMQSKHSIRYTNCASIGQTFNPPIALSDIVCWEIIQANTEEQWRSFAEEDFAYLSSEIEFKASQDKGRLAHLEALTQ